MRLILFLFFSLFILACATRYSATDSYGDILARQKNRLSNSRTVLFFLVDGLPLATLKSQLSAGLLPNIENHFLKNNKSVDEAYAAFPSLTYTNIAGLLAEKPVHLSQAYGNSLVEDGKLIYFDILADREIFANRLQGQTIFSRLTAQGEKSVSLDYGLGTDATVSSEFTDLKVGLAAGLQDFLYLDQKRIDSLDHLLQTTKIDQWPRFIFVHLVGIDFLSHTHGPQSPQVRKYLSLLDRRLAPVLARIAKADLTSHKTISILSADHGFSTAIKRKLSIEKLIVAVDDRALILNESRMAGVYTRTALIPLKQKLLAQSQIEIVAFHENDHLIIESKKMKVSLRLVANPNCQPFSKAIEMNQGRSVCPEKLDAKSRDLFYPYFILNLIYYFQSVGRPNLIIVPTEGTSFSHHAGGVHGGPTPNEIQVPLLLRNASLPANHQKPAVWQLLQLL